MTTYIALFRGINVGGSNVLPMKELRRTLEGIGCADVHTYINSGNVVCRSAVPKADRLSALATAAVTKRHGFAPRVMVLTRQELERAAAGNPYPEAEDRPKHLHLFFLAAPAKKADLTGLEALKAKGERFALKGKVFYVHAPGGAGCRKVCCPLQRDLQEVP